MRSGNEGQVPGNGAALPASPPTFPLSPRLSARLAGVFFVAGGLLSVMTVMLPQPAGTSRGILVAFAAIAIASGAAALALPWERWPRRATLALPALGMAFVSIGNWADGGQPYTFGVTFVVIFVWIGITQPRGSCLLFAFPAALAYIGSILVVESSPAGEAASAVFVIPVAVFLGESLAWLTGRLQRSEGALEKERALLHVMRATAVAANEAATVHDAIASCLESVCSFTGWPVGHAFLMTEDRPSHLVSSVWRLEDPVRHARLRKVTDTFDFGPGVGLPGRVVAWAKPCWIRDVANDPTFVRGTLGEDLAVRGGFSFPVLSGSEVVGVLEFFSEQPEEPDEQVLRVMAHVGEQLGRVIERDRSERSIAVGERRLAEAQRTAHLGSWEWDVTTNTVWCSRELLDLLGLEGEASTRSYEEFVGGLLAEEGAWLRETMTRQAHSGLPVDVEVHRIGPDGAVRDYHLRGRLEGSATGGPPKMIGTLQDITKRTRAERELEGALAGEREAQARLRALDAMKSTLLHAVAHDLRSPLASILASVSVLEGEKPDTKLHKRLLAGVGDEGRKMDRLLGDLLDLDRIERGILEPNRKPTDLGALAWKVVGETKGLAGRSVHVRPDRLIAEVEESKVERILENLLRNVVRHTPSHSPAWINMESEDHAVLIAVEDAGDGVPDELKGRIFEPFNRGGAAKESGQGFGIGLSLVARFAELHGGRAWVEDRRGGGSSFRVLLPTPHQVESSDVATAAAEAR